MKAPQGFVWLPILLVILAALAVFGGAYWYVHTQVKSSFTETVYQCDKKVCPDGSTVGGTIQFGNDECDYVCPAATSSTTGVSVLGMSKYTDADFGFSFWYPSGWKLQQEKVLRYGDSGRSKTVTLTGDDRTISLNVYDANMLIGFTPAVTLGVTMGNLGMAPASDTGSTSSGVVVRLSKTSSITISGHAFGESDTDVIYLAKTITTDPSVARPASTAEQVKVVQAEKDAYIASVPSASRYTDAMFGFSFSYPTNLKVTATGAGGALQLSVTPDFFITLQAATQSNQPMTLDDLLRTPVEGGPATWYQWKVGMAKAGDEYLSSTTVDGISALVTVPVCDGGPYARTEEVEFVRNGIYYIFSASDVCKYAAAKGKDAGRIFFENLLTTIKLQ